MNESSLVMAWERDLDYALEKLDELLELLLLDEEEAAAAAADAADADEDELPEDDYDC